MTGWTLHWWQALDQVPVPVMCDEGIITGTADCHGAGEVCLFNKQWRLTIFSVLLAKTCAVIFLTWRTWRAFFTWWWFTASNTWGRSGAGPALCAEDNVQHYTTCWTVTAVNGVEWDRIKLSWLSQGRTFPRVKTKAKVIYIKYINYISNTYHKYVAFCV